MFIISNFQDDIIMALCDYPGCERKEALPFRCKYCGKSFCTKHRLPENHACEQLHLSKSPISIAHESKIAVKGQVDDQTSDSPAKDQRFTTYDFDDDDSQYYGQGSDGTVYNIKPTKRQTQRKAMFSQVGDSFTTGKEFLDIIIGSLIVILSFGFTAILMSNVRWAFSGFLIAIILVSYLSTIIPRKLLAKRFGCTSRYMLTKLGLLISALTIISPIKYLSPGMLVIPELDFISKKRSGIISAIGSIINITLGVAFILLGIFLADPSIAILMLTGAFITSQITLLRLIPMRFLPGKRILNWSWAIFTIMLVLTLAIFIMSILLGVMGVRIITI